jgi:sugar lactone lactonase YvrE
MPGRLLIAMCAAALGLQACGASTPRAPLQDILIDDQDVYPESVTSTADGAVINGSIKGVIFRAPPRGTLATAWVRPSPENGLQAVFGVLADEKSKTLWVCSVPAPFAPPKEGENAAVVALDLASGAHKATYPFPAPRSVCNDVTVAPDGALFVADTPNGRILKLAAGAKSLVVFGQDEKLKGIDGLAFSGDGTLYVNIVTRGALLRVARNADGTMGPLTELKLSQPVGGPDGFRLIEGNRFLLAEGTTGRIDEVTIDGDGATIRVLREGLNSSPGVTLVGDTAYATEGKIGYLIDPKLKGQDPGPFKIHAIPIR